MAGRTRRPLPKAPNEHDDGEEEYQDPGFEDGEFSDDDYENAKHGRKISEAEPSDDEDYLEPEPIGGKPSLPPRHPTGGRQLPPSPGQSNGSPAIPPPRVKAQSRAPVVAPTGEFYSEVREEQPKPPRQPPNRKPSVAPPSPLDDLEYQPPPSGPLETYEELPEPQTYEDVPQQEPQEVYEDFNESISRPALPAPMQHQDEYLAPGVGAGPTEEYSEIHGGTDPNQNHNTPLPPQISADDIYQDMNDASEESQISSMQKQIQGMQLKKSTRELPLTPKPKIQGVQMVGGLNSLRLNKAMCGLRPVARTVFEERAPPKTELSDVDPCTVDFHAKAALFGQRNVFPRTQTVIREDRPSPRTSTGSNKSDSGVDVRDTPPALRPVGNRPGAPPPPAEQQTASTPPSTNRSLPPLPPAEAITTKPSLSSRPLPNVPDVSSSSLENLSGCSWFFDISRNDANDRIKALRVEGAYLVRNSTKDHSNPYTLTLFFKSKIWHLHIRLRDDGMFAIGTEKSEEECFATVPELIEYHTHHCIILAGNDGGETRLIRHPRK